MRVLFFALSCAVLLPEALAGGFIFSSINFCKNPCKSASDCKSNQRCTKFIFCKKKTCQNKPKPKPTTTPATTTTALPPNTCPPPEKSDLISSFRCSGGHKKNMSCFMTCKGGYCPKTTTMTVCRCKLGKCSWDRDLTNGCKAKNKDECKVSKDCASGHRCSTKNCGKVCVKSSPPKPPPCPNKCITSLDCPSGSVCTGTICKQCKRLDTCSGISCKTSESCKKGMSCVKTPCGKRCQLPDICPPGPQCKSSVSCKNEMSCVKTLCGMRCQDTCSTLQSCKINSDCKLRGSCVKTSCGLRCKSKETCLPTLSCKTSATCKHGMSCVKTTCGMQCKHQRPEIGECTCPQTGCPRGQMCMESFCGKQCRPMLMPPPDFNKCLRPCSSTRKCHVGYKCQKQVCGLGCVVESAPSCPVADPTSGMPPLPVMVCPKVVIECLVGDPKACGENEVCCHSKICRKNICQAKVNNCPANEIAKCFSDADCPLDEKCVHHDRGCRKCTKGFFCPRHKNRCNEDSDCKSPMEKCTVGDDACRTCSFPGIGHSCIGEKCSSDSECDNGKTCTLMKSGCRTCQMPRLGDLCTGRCISDHTCRNGETCTEHKPGCKICKKKI